MTCQLAMEGREHGIRANSISPGLPLDAFGTLIFQVIGQQLSVSATRTIVARLEQRFGGHLPSPQVRRATGRAYGFDHLPTEDEMVELAERWRPYRSLAVNYLFASEYEKGT